MEKKRYQNMSTQIQWSQLSVLHRSSVAPLVIPQLSQFTCALAGVSVLFSQDIYWKEKVVIRCVVGLQQGYHLRMYHCMLYCVGGTVEVR